MLVIGAPKSGTTTLYRVLSDHPYVYMARVKEPTFFSSQRHYANGLDWYAAEFFASAGEARVRGEATPWYLYSRDAADRIAHDLASSPPRLVVALREPVSRAYSMFWDQVAAGYEHRSFAEAVAGDPVDPGTVASWSEIPRDELRRAYLTTGLYAYFLERWVELFGWDRILVLIHEELIRHPESELGRLWRFLELPRHDLSDLPHSNPASEPVSQTVERTLRLVERVPPSARRTVARVMGDERTRRIAAWITRANRRPTKYPPLDPEVEASLRHRFRPHTSRLQEMLGRPLDVWY